MSKIELKPCPFCGGSGQLVMADYNTSLHPSRILNSYYVICAGCGVRTPTYSSDIRQEVNGIITIKANGAEMAAEAWNSRFEDTIKFFKDAIENPIDDGVYISRLRPVINLEDEKNEN